MRSNRLILILLLSLIPAILSAQDNVTVLNTIYSNGKYYDVNQPVMTDSTNIDGKTFDNDDLLQTFISFPQESDYIEPLKANIYDYFQFSKPRQGARFYMLSFYLSVDQYTKTILKVESPSIFKVYINGVSEGVKSTIEDSLSQAKTMQLKFPTIPTNKYHVVIKYMSLATSVAPQNLKIKLEPEDGTKQINYNLSHTDKREITITDLLVGKRLLSSTISPNADYVLLKYKTTLKDGKAFDEKELLSLKNNRRVALNPKIDYTWMPASNKLFYVENTSEYNNLIAVDPQTLEENVLAYNIPSGVKYFTPDEKTLIYIDNEKTKDTKSDLILLTVPESVQPGNKDRKFLSRYQLASGIKERLTFGKNSTTLNDISNDSQYILYSVSEYEPTKRPFFFKSMYRLNLQSLAVDTLFEKEGFAGSALFSPDGTKVLIEGSAEAFGGIGNTLPTDQIPNSYNKLAFVMNINTKQVEAITRDFAPSIDRSYWNKEDGMIYFVTTDKDYSHVYRYNPNNKHFEQLPLSEEVVQNINLASHAPKATYYGMSIANSTRAYLYDLKNDRSTLIADPYQSTLDDLKLSKVQDWNFTSSDGSTIYGRYYLPPNFDPDKKYPMIVYYYGGTVPTARTLEAPYPAQVYAALGYVVYVLQPSGAIGFGQVFAAQHVNGWGKQNARDIIDGTKLFVKEHPFVDDRKIGCIGASYGGYMTMYLQTQIDIFAAAVSHAGISSISSYWGEGYWGYTYSSGASANSYPWNNSELYVEQSPLFNADKINTPLLMLHGTADTNVPIGESMQMYTALKVLGKPVEFIQVKGENHGIRDFKKRIEWNHSIYAWFAKWLQDDPSWWNAMYSPSN